jgi:hypothetical protein
MHGNCDCLDLVGFYMRKFLKESTLCSVLAGGLLMSLHAEEAVVTEGRINVRGQPSLIGEVVTQLQKGDKVQVLERIKNEKPKPGDPDTWAKIKLPENTPVWVFSPFVKDGVVSASKLNLRAGPGENYSVVGRLEKGAAVKSIRTIEEWMEIEAPTDAFAFVDASLIKSSGGEIAATTTVAAVTPPTIAATTPVPRSETPSPATNVATATPTETAPPTTISTTAETPPPVVATPPATAATTPPVSQPLPQVAPAVPTKAESAPGKRLVRREGIIRATKSIQAPTWYELIHPQTKVTIGYLHGEKLGVNLKEHRGQKVVVSGEEAIDPRWPNTPILELETLDVVP